MLQIFDLLRLQFIHKPFERRPSDVVLYQGVVSEESTRITNRPRNCHENQLWSKRAINLEYLRVGLCCQFGIHFAQLGMLVSQ